MTTIQKPWTFYLRHPKMLWCNRHKVRLWRRFTYWTLQKLGMQERFAASYYGARFHPFPSSLSKAIWLFGETFRRQDMLFLREALRPDDTFVDVGANIGTHSICMARQVGLKRICSFEPHPRIFHYFRKNILLNRTNAIQSFNVALGETEGVAPLSDELWDDRNWLRLDNQSAATIEVPVRTLDSFSIEGENLVVKIDIEGYELYALQGGEQTLQRAHLLYLEIGDRHTLRCGYPSRTLLEFLTARGWRLFRFKSLYELSEITADYSPPDVENIVGTRNVDQLRSRLTSYYILQIAESM